MNLIFDIENLITENVEARLTNINDLSDKIEFLFALLEFTENDKFTTDEINDINNQYLELTNERYELVYLDMDSKEFILEYAKYFNDFDDIKRAISGLCGELTKEEVLMDLEKKLNLRKADIEAEKSRLIDNLEFDEIIYPDNYEEKKKPTQEPKKKSLAEVFAEIEKKRRG